MHIELDNVDPEPICDTAIQTSEVWGKQVTLDGPKFYELYAPSGRGKTTFTHIVYGLRKDYSGAVNISGKRLGKLDSAELSELRQRCLSIVFQDLRLFPHLTARENIQVKNALQSYLSDAQLLDLCRELSIDGLLDKRCDQISFGERQRVALVRAMAQPFKWLLLDEPFSHLDAENIEKVCRLVVRECDQRQAGCLLMTLDPTQRFDNSHTLRL